MRTETGRTHWRDGKLLRPPENSVDGSSPALDDVGGTATKFLEAEGRPFAM